MPIYEYKCKNCENIFEELLFYKNKKPISCPECSSENTEKLISAVSILTGSSVTPVCASSCESKGSCCSDGTCPMR